MKRFFQFMVVVLFITGCTKTDDLSEVDPTLKSAENGNYTEQFSFSPAYEEYYLEVICDGEIIDILHGDGMGLKGHAILHYKNGEMQWAKFMVKGSLTSETTGVTYNIHEQNRGEFDKDEGFYYLIAHTNAIGDDGTHYIVSVKFIWPIDEYEGIVWDNGTWEYKKAMCVPNKKL